MDLHDLPFLCGCFSKRRDHWADAELSNSAEAAKKRREKSPNSSGETDKQPQMALHVESVDTVDNVPIETESSLEHKESSDDGIEELGVLRSTSESTDELIEGASLERSKAEHVPATSSPVGADPELTVEPCKGALREPNYVPPSSCATEIPIKTSLQRVGSDPTLSNDDQKKKGKDEEPVGNFRRSCSLRERGTRKVQELHAKARSVSDENLKEFERKKKQILRLEEPGTSDLQGVKNTVEGLLPSDLHGVLESGFVKRYSKKFEGVDDVLELEGSAALTSKEEVDVECAPAEGEKITEEGQEDSMANEEPEPGLVKKHKEGYELKHRESLKRRALLQRGISDERKSAKKEGDEVEGSLAVDAHSESVFTAGELENELRGVNVVALVKKVNEDMKKEVTVRRVSASRKEQDLRAYVEKAGERMKNALVDEEGGTSPKDNDNEIDSEQISEESFTGKIKRNTLVFVLEEDSEDFPSNDSQSTGTPESRQTVEVKPSVAHNVTASVESVIEGKLQPLNQEELEKGTGDQQAREVDQEVVLSVSNGKTRNLDAFTEQGNRTIAQGGAEPSEITAEKVVTSELLVDKTAEQSEQNSDNILQKGLVKRHTLLIEGKLQPSDQEIEKTVERPDGQERHFAVDQKASSSLSEGETNSAALHTEQTEVNVVQNMNSGMETKEKSDSKQQTPLKHLETANTSELSKDGESIESGHDTDNVPPKGLVKRHTLLIEEKITPLDQVLEKKVEKETGNETERTDDQDACASPLKGDKRAAIDSQQDGLGATQDLRASVEVLETGVSGAKEPSEDLEDKGSEQDTENVLQKGLVKRHTLLIEERLQPLDQESDEDVEKDDGKESELVLDKEAVLSVEDQGQLRYQIERTSDSEVEQCADENQDNESVSGLVKREKLRIEERLQTTSVESKQELEQEVVSSDEALLETVDGEEGCQEVNTTEKRGEEIEQIKEEEEEEEHSEVAVDTSSVVRVKEQAQHLEGIIRVKQDGEKVKIQTSKDGDPKASDEAPKFFIVPREGSDENIDEEDEVNTVEKISEDKMDVLSDSAVNIALLKAQENLDSEKENLEFDNENFVDWKVANVKQRRQMFEDIVRDYDKDSRKGDEESENKSNSLRRHESMPKMTRTTEKLAFRRRSVSDVTATVSSGSNREVGYTIEFRNRVGGSSSSSSLPRDWSPLEHRQEQGEKDVFSPEISRKDKLKKNVEFDDRRDTCQSVKETIQVLDSKNQRNVSNIS